MNLNYADIEIIVKNLIIVDEISYQKGSRLVFYKGKGYYIWRNDKYLFLKGKHFWNQKLKYPVQLLINSN